MKKDPLAFLKQDNAEVTNMLQQLTAVQDAIMDVRSVLNGLIEQEVVCKNTLEMLLLNRKERLQRVIVEASNQIDNDFTSIHNVNNT